MQQPLPQPFISPPTTTRPFPVWESVTVVVTLVVMAGLWLVLRPDARTRSVYRPGDCVQTPAIERSTLESWENTTAFDHLYMIADVGAQKYRLREWGGRRRDTNEWYPGYVNDTFFGEIDNKKVFMPVPCPEQGPDPEPEVRLSLSNGDSLAGGRETYFVYDADGSVTRRVTTFTHNVTQPPSRDTAGVVVVEPKGAPMTPTGAHYARHARRTSNGTGAPSRAATSPNGTRRRIHVQR